MNRAAPILGLLAACATPEAPTPLGVALPDTCATLDDADLRVAAGSLDGTVALRLDHTPPDMSRGTAGDAAYELANLSSGPSELHIYTGLESSPPCADLAAETSWMADYRAISGNLYLLYMVGEQDGTLEGGTVDVTIAHLVLQDGDDAPLEYGELRLGTMEVETPSDVVE